MSDVPFYAQGSQLANTGFFNQQPSLNQGTSPTMNAEPFPGMGAAIQGSTTGLFNQTMNAEPFPGMGAAIQGAISGGQVDWPRVQRTLGISNAQMDSMMQGGNLSTFASQIQSQAASGASQGASQGGGVPTTRSEPWLSPDELRAKPHLQSTRGEDGGGDGGGAGGGSGSGAGTGTGTGTGVGAGAGTGGVTQGNAPTGSTPDSLNQSSTPLSNTLGYQNPTSLQNPQSGVPGYTAPGSTNSGGQAGVLQMQQANPQGALDQYKNTPGYQLLNAPGAYEQSPGYQYAMDQSMNQVQNAASAKGMLESGAVIKSMQQTASGLAQQDYGNWWNRQNQLYGDYQNRLQGMAGGPTGGADAMTAGANAAQANLQTGSNLGSLFGNQGTTGMGGIINTAAAQSGNMINAGQQQASVNSANQATQLAGATLGSNQQQARGLF